ncbi:MAG: VWA domain-containing protein [Polyangiales bacterium]
MEQPSGSQVNVEDLQRRLDHLWREPDSMRLENWFRRTWLRLSRRGEVIRWAAIEGFGDGSKRSRVDWREHRPAIVAELAANVQVLEDRARTHDELDGTVLSWLHDVAAWTLAMDHLARRPIFAAHYSLVRGVGSRAFRHPVASLPAHVQMSVDALCREAAEETDLLSRREGLLRAAQRILLDAAAVAGESGCPGGEGALGRGYDAVCEELRQLQRMARVVDPALPIDHQLREAAKKGDGRVLRGASAARAYLRAGSTKDDAAMKIAARLSSSPDTGEMPARVNEAIEVGYKEARARLDETIDAAPPLQRFRLQAHAADLRGGAEAELLRMTLDASAGFDLGVSLEQETREVVEELRQLVSYPTATLTLSPVDEVAGVKDAIIEDPRLLLYHLASRRLLQRRFVRNRRQRRRVGSVRASVRFYLLDGSSSMRGPRGRMRDALFVAELASLVARLQRPEGRIRSLLYYRYFDSRTEVTRRVATVDEALATIRTIFAAQRTGGTDIQSALLESLTLIEEQRHNDVELSRAQIVLVTDGQADVDPGLLREAQARLDVPVRVSVIALGAESPALRRFAAEQRHAGLEVVYHHVDDEGLRNKGSKEELAPDFGLAPATNYSEDEPHEEDGEDLELLVEALEELGLGEEELTSSRRRTLEIQRMERSALARSFDDLFPPPQVTTEAVGFEEDAVSVLHLLSVVAEVLSCTPAVGWRVQSDAIAIMRRLLREHGMSKARYLRILGDYPQQLRGALDEIRALTR